MRTHPAEKTGRPRVPPRATVPTAAGLEHRDLDRYGAQASSVRESVGGDDGGWGAILEQFAVVV